MHNKRLSILSAIPRACNYHHGVSNRQLNVKTRIDQSRLSRPIFTSEAPKSICVAKMFHTSLEVGKRDTNVETNRIPLRRDGAMNPAKLVSGESESKPESERDREYARAIEDLNNLQSNTQTVALAKYKKPQEILPLFARQLELAGIELSDLDRLRIVHVSGTKGKGSTCAFVDSILRYGGLKTGFYNSPHLVKVTERIRINGEPLDDIKFSLYFRQVYSRLLAASTHGQISMPSYFSFLTILAFHVFLKEEVDCAIIEVGIGGEYDPTNIIQRPSVCGITTIHYDHTNILGDTIESIAWSKAGIIKRGVPAFTVPQDHRIALDVISSRAQERQSPLSICKPLDALRAPALGISGSAQYLNASLAFHLANHILHPPGCMPDGHRIEEVGLSWPDLSSSAQKALIDCRWPGRCEIVKYPKITFFLDGAHTTESMRNCLEWFTTCTSQGEAFRVLLVNIIGERNKKEILQPLCEYDKFDMVIFSTNKVSASQSASSADSFGKLHGDRSQENVDSMASCWDHLTREKASVEHAYMKVPSVAVSFRWLEEFSSNNPDRTINVLVTGSLHLVGAVSEALSTPDMKLL